MYNEEIKIIKKIFPIALRKISLLSSFFIKQILLKCTKESD